MDKRVIIIEDEPLIAMELEDELSANGWHVVASIGRFEEAARVAREEDFDVAILDYNLSRRTSGPIAHILAGRRIPFVYLSGGSADDLPREPPAAALLGKPVRPGLLNDLLTAIVTP